MTSKNDPGKRYNPFQHALARPENYIGPVVTTEQECWVFNSEEKRFENRSIKYNPGLERIFVEIKSNIEDNRWRSEKMGTQMKKIDVTMDDDPESDTYGLIVMRNDGAHISAEQTEYTYEDYTTGKTTTQVKYPAETLFGEMLTSTNFTDDDTRKTSGRNGIGAKATNIFSLYFEVEHADPVSKKLFKQVYTEHGSKRTPPEVTRYAGKTGYTQISFIPDYEYFKYPGLDDDLVALFTRHLYECAMITGLTVTLNDEKLSVKNLESYARMYFPSKDNNMMLFTSATGDECVIVEGDVPSVNEMATPYNVSFINGIYTRDGGTHVDAWVDKIFPILVRQFNERKLKKGASELKTSAKKLYPYFIVFVRAEAPGPTFDSQSKNKLITPHIVLHSEDESKKFNDEVRAKTEKMLKWNFVTLLEEKLEMENEATRQNKEKKSNKSLVLGKKATDANNAGKKGLASGCILYITEGLSAKTFADTLISLQENGSDHFGSFALKGKFLNVQNATFKEINENSEVQMMKKLLGLVYGIDYSQPEMRATLRYGGVRILADADDDGIHIRGLVLNFFYKFWPQLFIPDENGKTFVSSLSTAVTMVRKGGVSAKAGNTKNPPQLFYSNPSFKKWYATQTKASTKGLSIKYYKGLGTHRKGDGDHKYYLDNPKIVEYILNGDEPEYMKLGFNKEESDWRKQWITNDMQAPNTIRVNEDDPCDKDFKVEGELALSEFVDDQLIIYHRMTLRRALPCIYDGMKEAQRKIYYGISTDPSAKKSCVNLENLAGSVKKATGYHHGAKSLEDGIKKMAMGFVGSNNIPLLENGGEFGTRNVGGEDAAAARYIETRADDICDFIFRKEDEVLYKKNSEDNVEVEFEYYMPVIPIIAINGAEGMASGYSTDIPCYNPDDVFKWVETWIRDPESVKSLPVMKPWYRNFKGEIELEEKGVDSQGRPKYTSWISKGILEEEVTTLKSKATKKTGWWLIKEAPIGLWTENLKCYLEYLHTGTPPEGSKKKKTDKKFLADFQKGTVDLNQVLYRIKPTPDFIPDMNVTGNFNILKKKSTLKNIVAVDENGYPCRFDRIEDLMELFCKKRLDFYGKRKVWWLKAWKKDLLKEKNRRDFIRAVDEKKLELKQDDEPLHKAMIDLGLTEVDGSFDYLLGMQVRSLTLKKIKEIESEIARIEEKVTKLENATPQSLWLDDIAELKTAYAKFLKTRKD